MRYAMAFALSFSDLDTKTFIGVGNIKCRIFIILIWHVENRSLCASRIASWRLDFNHICAPIAKEASDGWSCQKEVKSTTFIPSRGLISLLLQYAYPCCPAYDFTHRACPETDEPFFSIGLIRANNMKMPQNGNPGPKIKRIFILPGNINHPPSQYRRKNTREGSKYPV